MYFLVDVLYKQYITKYNCRHFTVNKLAATFSHHVFLLTPDAVMVGSTGRAEVTYILQPCFRMPTLKMKEGGRGYWGVEDMKRAMGSVLVAKMRVREAARLSNLLNCSLQERILKIWKTVNFISHQTQEYMSEYSLLNNKNSLTTSEIWMIDQCLIHVKNFLSWRPVLLRAKNSAQVQQRKADGWQQLLL
jgi:hypothetical protein